MSLQVPAAPLPNAKENIKRQSVNYHPTIWENHFPLHASDQNFDASTQREFERLKEEVRRMLNSMTDTSSDILSLIDAIQRLGVAYHFEKEIKDQLQILYQDGWDGVNNLNSVALQFRLLRQQGYNIPCDIFSKFKDNQGNFIPSLINDVPGMLSLYEAAHLGIRGEDVLDEAIVFTASHLTSMVTQLSPLLADQITHALNRPICKGLPKMEARYYIDIYSRLDNSENQTLLKFAKVDFNMLQAQHQKELSSLIKWWKSLDFTTKLPYARDRIVELYFWMMGIYFEPQYSLIRSILTKVIAILSILDDTYDVYGTYDEVVLFTEAIKRWDISTIDILPEYMKVVYKELLDVYNEVEKEMSIEGRSYCMDYAIGEMKRQVQAYFEEAKWRNAGYVPKMEEYMKVALVSSGYKLLATTSWLGMGEIANKQAFDWISNDPKIIVASAIISRLLNDFASRHLERERGHIASAVECYIMQHGVSEEEAIRSLRREVSNAWKDVNQEMLKPTAVPMPLLERLFNLARAMYIFYEDDYDHYTNSHSLKDVIASMYVNPIPV